MSEAFVYMWHDPKNSMYYIGSHKGTPDDGYTHSSKVMEQFKAHSIPEGFSRRILAYGTEPDMRQLEIDLLNNRKEKCWDKYYNVAVCFPPPVKYGKDNPNYVHGRCEDTEHIKEYNKAYREKNLEKLREQDREKYKENRLKIRERKREYYKENREKIQERQREFREKNPEYSRKYYARKKAENPEYNKKYYKENLEKLREYQREHREKINEQKRKYSEKNREKLREYQREYRARKKAEKQQAQGNLDNFSLDEFFG